MRCPNCGKELPEGMRFCGYCGTPLPTLEREEERKLASVMFVDVVGFTRLSERMDPEEVSDLLDRFYKVVDDVVRRHQGHVDKLIGDAALVLFGVPRALENPAYHAIAAALDLQEQVQRLGIQVHTGIHTGEVLVTHMGEGAAVDYTVIGDTVNVAQRLESLAQAGEVLVSDRTWRMVEGLFEGAAVGELTVKGREQPIRVWMVQGRGGKVLQRGLPRKASLRGRDPEVARLREALARSGDVLVGLVADAGYGKTRILDEVMDQPDLLLVASPNRAAGEMFQEFFRGGALQSAEEVFRQLRQALEHRPPLKVIRVEDLHWADDLSLEILERLVVWYPHPLKMAITTRPDGYSALQRLVQSFRVREGSTVVIEELEGLPREALEEIASELAPDLPESLKNEFVERAQGNPLFLEEMIRTWVEEGRIELPDRIEGLIQERVDRLPREFKELLKKIAVLGYHFNPHQLRLIGVDPDDLVFQRLVQTGWLRAHPGGWAFRNPLVQEGIYRMLLKKERRELHQRLLEALEREGAPEEVLAFHALEAQAWEKALDYALKASERLLRMGAVRDAGRVIEWAEQALAHAGREEDRPYVTYLKARWLRSAGEPKEALGLVETLLSQVSPDRDLFWELLTLQVDILIAFGRVEEARALLDRTPPPPYESEWARLQAVLRLHVGDRLRELAHRLDQRVDTYIREERWHDAEKLVLPLLQALRYAGDIDHALRVLQNFLTRIPEVEERAHHARLLHEHAELLRLKGDLDQAEKAFQEALELVDRLGDRTLLGPVLFDFARLLRIRGDYRRARQLLMRALRVGQSLQSFGIQFHTTTNLALVALDQGDLVEAYRRVEDALRLAEEAENPRSVGIALHLRAGIRMLYEGVVDVGVVQALQRALDIARASEEAYGIALNTVLLGWDALVRGDRDRARTCLEEALRYRETLSPGLRTLVAWGREAVTLPVPEDLVPALHLPREITPEGAREVLRAVARSHRNLWRPAIWMLAQKTSEGDILPLAHDLVREMSLPAFFAENLPFTVRD